MFRNICNVCAIHIWIPMTAWARAAFVCMAYLLNANAIRMNSLYSMCEENNRVGATLENWRQAARIPRSMTGISGIILIPHTFTANPSIHAIIIPIPAISSHSGKMSILNFINRSCWTIGCLEWPNWSTWCSIIGRIWLQLGRHHRWDVQPYCSVVSMRWCRIRCRDCSNGA